MLKVIAIVAMSENRAIGFENKIPWHIPEDQKRFAKLTKGHAVLMGRKTYESLPSKFRPLPGRQNIVCTRNTNWKPEEKVNEAKLLISKKSPKETIEEFRQKKTHKELWVIGGTQIYEQTLEQCDEIYLTLVKENHKGDSFFPEFENDFNQKSLEEFSNFSYIHYEKLKS